MKHSDWGSWRRFKWMLQPKQGEEDRLLGPSNKPERLAEGGSMVIMISVLMASYDCGDD